MLERNDRRSLVGVSRAPDRPALIESALDEALRKELVALAHFVDPDLGEELEARARRVDRGDRRRAVLEAPRARAVVEVLHVECEWLLHAPPADRARARPLRDALARVEERDPWAAHEPLQGPADEVVDPT